MNRFISVQAEPVRIGSTHCIHRDRLSAQPVRAPHIATFDTGGISHVSSPVVSLSRRAHEKHRRKSIIHRRGGAADAVSRRKLPSWLLGAGAARHPANREGGRAPRRGGKVCHSVLSPWHVFSASSSQRVRSVYTHDSRKHDHCHSASCGHILYSSQPGWITVCIHRALYASCVQGNGPRRLYAR